MPRWGRAGRMRSWHSPGLPADRLRRAAGTACPAPAPNRFAMAGPCALSPGEAAADRLARRLGAATARIAWRSDAIRLGGRRLEGLQRQAAPVAGDGGQALRLTGEDLVPSIAGWQRQADAEAGRCPTRPAPLGPLLERRHAIRINWRLIITDFVRRSVVARSGAHVPFRS